MRTENEKWIEAKNERKIEADQTTNNFDVVGLFHFSSNLLTANEFMFFATIGETRPLPLSTFSISFRFNVVRYTQADRESTFFLYVSRSPQLFEALVMRYWDKKIKLSQSIAIEWRAATEEKQKKS